MRLTNGKATVLALAAVVGAVTLVLSGCSSPKSSGASDGPVTINIGATLPLTGTAAAIGAKQQNGLLLGLQAAQEKLDGVTFHPEILDDQALAGPAVTQGTKLMADSNVPVLVTAFSAPPLAQLNIAQRYQVPLLNAGGNTPDLEGHEWLYNNAFMVTEGGFAVLSYAYKQLKIKDLSLIIDTSFPPATNTFLTATWKKLTGGKLNVVSIPMDATDASPYVAKALTTDPKALFLVGNGNAMALMIAAVEKSGVQLPLLSQNGNILATPEISNIHQPIYYPGGSTPISAKLTADYTAKYGVAPDFLSEQTYNFALVIGQIVQRLRDEGKEVTGVNVKAVLDDPKQTFDVDSGSISFNSRHIIDQAGSIFQSKDGAVTVALKNAPTR